MDLLRKTCRCCSMHGFRFCPAGVGGSLVDRHLQELRGVRDGCIGRASQEERLRLRLHELGLPLNGRRSDDISLRKLCQAMDISLQHPSGDRKGRDELVEALVSTLLSEVPVLGNLHASFVDACLKDLREVRDGMSGQAPQRDELEKRLCKFAIKDKRDHVVTLTNLCRSLELPIATSRGGMSKAEYVQQILTALLAESPASASVDDGKTALVDASLRELLAFRDSLTGQRSQRRELESRLEQFNMKDRRSDAVTLVDLRTSLGLATKHAGRYFLKADLVGQIVSTLLRRVPAAASRDVAKASVDASLQELRRVRDGLNEHAAQRRELEKCLDNIKMKDRGGDAVVLTDLCRSLELPIAKPSGGGWMKRLELVEQIVAALLAELPAGASVDARKAAFVDASLQELRRVRDGVDEQAARRHELEKCLDKIKMKDQGPDAVGVTDLCHSLELPVAKPGGSWMKKAELVEQIISTLLKEVFVPCSDVDKSSFDMAMEICRSFDESRCDLDSAVRRVCDTVESCVCLGSVLMGTQEEELLRRS